MGVRKRFCVDLALQQLQKRQQAHRKCHHRQSSQQTAANRKTIKQQIKQNQNEQQQQQHLQQKQFKIVKFLLLKQQQHTINEQQRNRQQKLYKFHSGQYRLQRRQKLSTNTKHKTQIQTQTQTQIQTETERVVEHLNLRKTTTNTNHNPIETTNYDKLKLLDLNKRPTALKRVWSLILLCLGYLTIWSWPRMVSPLNQLKKSLTMPSITIMTMTTTTLIISLSQTSLLVAGAVAAYENPSSSASIKYIHSNSDIEESDGMIVEDIDVNSNEQQLLAYYKKAQKEHEELKRQQSLQRLKQQQYEQQQQQQQQRHHHQERDTKRNSGISQQQKQHLQQHQQQQIDFNDILPTADVISTLDTMVTPKKRSTATKKPIPPATTPTSTTTASTTTTTTTTSATATTTASSEEKCEPKVLDEVPAEPYYDFSDVAEDAARQFTDFLANKFSANLPVSITDQIRDEVRRKANGIATYALNEDEHLLAFALAAPSIHTVVVKFRENVTIPLDQVHNRNFLGSYWRELGYAWNSTDGSQEWGAPFRDCYLLVGRWLWPFRISYSESKFKIVAAAFIAADEDVCNDGLEQIFGRKHGCDRNTTFCLLTKNKPAATRDVYTCICKESYYLPNASLQGFVGDIVEMSEGYDNYSCIPCPAGCSSCDSTGECLYGELQEAVSLESLLKVSVGSVLGACILCCLVLSVIVFQQRKCKAIASGMWTVLETILLGIVLLYASVAIHFFPASTERCLIEPWLRELGFITCYGAIILKLYRHLVDFRTRKAHRWVLRDVDLLKYLGTMVFAVVCYMSAFTASSLDLLETAQLESLREVNTNTCQPLKWEFVTQASEILILCFGLHLAYASRNANTQFRERQFLVSTLIIEYIVSLTFYIIRYFYLPAMSPSTIFLALFLRSQLTNTIALGLIFVPKLWYQHKQLTHHRHNHNQ